MEFETRLVRQPDGNFVLNGTKYYCTGALTATFIPVFALDEAGRLVAAYVDRHASGVEVEEDWHAMGQRATVSGTTRPKNVLLPADRIVLHGHRYEKPQIFGAFGQLLRAAIDVGIARNALDAAAAFVRTHARPWFESGHEKAAQEPHIIQQFGRLGVKLFAAEAPRRLRWRSLPSRPLAAMSRSRSPMSFSVSPAPDRPTSAMVSTGIGEMRARTRYTIRTAGNINMWKISFSTTSRRPTTVWFESLMRRCAP
jgi:alkylation response protein AidB-like acyl-CoA dehydrogenase